MSYQTRRAEDSRQPDDALSPIALVCCLLVAIVALAFFIVDKQVYVSDDRRNGQSAATAYLDSKNRPVDEQYAPLRQCYDMADTKYGRQDRSYRHFMFGCSGIWLAPPEQSGD